VGVLQGRYDEANKVGKKLEKLYLEHPEGFDPVNVLEASTSFTLLAMRDGDRERVLHYLEVGAKVVEQWGRPTTWRSVPCCYAQAEAALRFWYSEKQRDGNNCDPRFEHWVKLSLKNVKAHASIYGIAASRFELLSGWYELMLGNRRKAVHRWRKGLRFAKKFNMTFDLVAINLVAHHVELEGKENLTLMTSAELQALTKTLNLTDLQWHADWRLVC